MDTDQLADTPTDPLRATLRGMWSAASASWAEHAAYVDRRQAAVAERMLALATPGPGSRVLELACGPGGLGLAAAPRVLPDGDVVLSDVVAEMTAIAARRAGELGLTQVSTTEHDLEKITEPDRSFDVVLCREGLMFAPDPARAAQEIARVLRPGGRVALTVWGPRERNPWLGLVFDAVGTTLGRPVPPPGVPGPFALSDAEHLAALFAEAGLVDVEVEEMSVPVRAPTFESWWTTTSTLAGPLATILAQLSPEALRALRGRLEHDVENYRTPAGLELPGVTLLLSARRPAPVGDPGSPRSASRV
jgi:SAM-dependent methyltransferase